MFLTIKSPWLRIAGAGALAALMPCVASGQKKSTVAPAAESKKKQSSDAPDTGDVASTKKGGNDTITAAKPSQQPKLAPPATSAEVGAQIGNDPAPPEMPKRSSYELGTDQIERFKKFLPKSFAKLMNRERFHIVAIGDEDVMMNQPGAKADQMRQSWAASFATELAMQFYYTGGVRVVGLDGAKKPKKGDPVPVPVYGPEITVRLLARPEKMMIHAMQSLTTHGSENQPDLVMVSFGVNDAVAGESLMAYAKSVEEVIRTVRSQGSELVLLGPTITAGEPPEATLGLTRAYADVMREIATDSGVLFVDSGDLAAFVAVADTVTEPEVAFDQIVHQYRRLFDLTGAAECVHPLPPIHRIIGKKIYADLVKKPAAAPWSLANGVVTVQSDEKMTFGCQLTNPGEDEATFAVLPLVLRDWKPLDAAPQITLKGGETKAVEVIYGRRPGGMGGMPASEPQFRLPVLLSGAGMSRIEVVRAEVRPFSLLWKPDTLFNQEKNFALESMLINTSGAPQTGAWTAEWLGQKRNGDFSLSAGQKKPLAMSFNLPVTGDPWRATSPLTMEVSIAGMKLRFDRMIEISRNIGLRQTVQLTPLSEPDKAPADGETPGVRLKADADANSLFLTFDISGINIEDRNTGRGAFGLHLGLDGRSYGKRLMAGAIDSLQLFGMAADGDYVFDQPQPWAFGTGYSAQFDARYVRARLSSTGTGARRLTITVPRNYLYLHEWALTNGNSQIGIRASLALWKGPREGVPNGDYPHDRAFTLVANGRHADDTEGLAVLELTDKPTVRWTVNPF